MLEIDPKGNPRFMARVIACISAMTTTFTEATKLARAAEKFGEVAGPVLHTLRALLGL